MCPVSSISQLCRNCRGASPGKIVRVRRLDFHPVPVSGMVKADLDRVRNHWRLSPRRARSDRAIHPDHRQHGWPSADICTRIWWVRPVSRGDLQQAGLPECLEAVVGDGSFAVVGDRELRSRNSGGVQWSRPRCPRSDPAAPHQRVVGFGHGALAKRIFQAAIATLRRPRPPSPPRCRRRGLHNSLQFRRADVEYAKPAAARPPTTVGPSQPTVGCATRQQVCARR